MPARVRAFRRGAGGAHIVFVHGAGGSHLVWGRQVAALARSHRVSAIDLPGHGRAQAPSCSAVAEFGAALVSFIEQCDREPAVLVGHSMGGAVALTVALERPDLVRGLVLVATGARLRVSPLVLEGLESEPQAALAAVNDLAFGPAATERMRAVSARAMREAGPGVLLGDLRACDAFDVMGRLGEIATPTLVIAATEDRLTPLKYARFLAAGINGARLHVVEGAGHMVMLERPDEASAVIEGFVAGLDQGVGAACGNASEFAVR